MKKSVISLLAGLVALSAGTGTVSAQDNDDAPNFVPVELFACNYRERKDQDDFDKALDLLEQTSATDGAAPYAAWRLFRMFYGPDQDFDFIFFAAWPDGSSMGRDYKNYFAVGGDADAAWNDAVDCNAAVMFASLEIMAPADSPDSDDFILTFSDCELEKGRSNGQAIAALRAYGKYRTNSGSPGGTWAWFPAYGGGDADFDFKLINSHADVEAFGNHFQWFGDNQAFQTLGALTDGLMKCDEARVYRGETIYNTWPDM